MRRLAAAFAQSAAFSVVLTSCHPFGCGSWRCVYEHQYTGGKRCNAVLAASLEIVRNTRLPPGSQYDAGAIQSELLGVDDILVSGAQLGMSRDAVYKDLDQAKNAYLQAYAARKGDPHQKLVALFGDVNECLPHSKPND